MLKVVIKKDWPIIFFILNAKGDMRRVRQKISAPKISIIKLQFMFQNLLFKENNKELKAIITEYNWSKHINAKKS